MNRISRNASYECKKGWKTQLQFVYREYPVRGCTKGQPESKLLGQLRCTTLLPSSSNFLKPYQPSPFDRLWGGNFRSVLKGTLLVHGKLLSSAGLNVDFVKVTLYEGLFTIWRLAEIDANISAERWIYIHPTFVICWVECRYSI